MDLTIPSIFIISINQQSRQSTLSDFQIHSIIKHQTIKHQSSVLNQISPQSDRQTIIHRLILIHQPS